MSTPRSTSHRGPSRTRAVLFVLALFPLAWAVFFSTATRTEDVPVVHVFRAPASESREPASDELAHARPLDAEYTERVEPAEAGLLDAAHATRSAPTETDARARTSLVEIFVGEAPSGRPVSAAWVELGLTPILADPEGEGAGAEERLQLLRTDDDGLLRAHLAPGVLRIVGWHETLAGGPESIRLEPGTWKRVEILLTSAHEFAGRVIDAHTREPLRDATISVWTFAEEDRARTAVDGSFSHPRFPRSKLSQQVRVEAEGYGAVVRYLRIREDGRWKLPAALEDGETRSGTGVPWLELELSRELNVRGRVVDQDARPIESVTVDAEGFFHVLPTVASRDDARALTNASGDFVLEGLRGDIGHAVVIRSPGFAEEIVEVPGVARTGDGSVAYEHDLGDVRMQRALPLVGVVSDADGFPVEDIEIVLIPRLTPHENASTVVEAASTMPLDVDVRVSGAEYRTRTGSEGTFLFDALPERAYELRVQRDTRRLVELEVHPVPGKGFRALNLELPIGTLVLRGEVRAEGCALAGARIEVRRHGRVGGTTSDANGRFRLAGLDGDGTYRLSVSGVSPRTGVGLGGDIEVWAFENPVLVLAQTASPPLARDPER